MCNMLWNIAVQGYFECLDELNNETFFFSCSVLICIWVEWEAENIVWKFHYSSFIFIPPDRNHFFFLFFGVRGVMWKLLFKCHQRVKASKQIPICLLLQTQVKYNLPRPYLLISISLLHPMKFICFIDLKWFF